MEKETTIEELINNTPAYLKKYDPFIRDESVPKSIIKYKPAIWQEDGVWHTLLGALPHDCIWTVGTSPEESMQEFDKELQQTLNPRNGTVRFLSSEQRKNLHHQVSIKIDNILNTILESATKKNGRASKDSDNRSFWVND
jgi:hypothetical protein